MPSTYRSPSKIGDPPATDVQFAKVEARPRPEFPLSVFGRTHPPVTKLDSPAESSCASVGCQRSLSSLPDFPILALLPSASHVQRAAGRFAVLHLGSL